MPHLQSQGFGRQQTIMTEAKQTPLKGAAIELGTERIRKLLVQYSLPAIIAMTASSLYNMVDSIFIGLGVGPMAISGLALTFPLMNLSAAFGSLVGAGAATLISMRLGQKDYASAQRILGNVVILNLIIGLGFTVVTLLFLDPILYFFGASDATIGYARDYMTIILAGNVVTHMYLGLNAVLRSSGHPRKSMYATINTVIINAILDPLFIYGFGWGIRGAAIATILAQVISLIWQFRLLSNRNELLHFQPGIYRLRQRIVKDILAIGMSPFLMNVTACFIVILINKGLKEHGGDLMIGAYGLLRDDRHGAEPGHAAHCRLQFRSATVRPRAAGSETYDCRSDLCHGYRVPDRRADAATGGFGLYDRCGIDPVVGHRHAHSFPLFPHHRLSDGHDELFPKHRHGVEGDFPLFVPTAAVLTSGTSVSAPPIRQYGLGRQLGRMVQHAVIGSVGIACRGSDAHTPVPYFPCRARTEQGLEDPKSVTIPNTQR